MSMGNGGPGTLDGSGEVLVRGGDGWNAEHRGEGRMQRADRNFAELLQELRVSQTGVQILFAFVLSLAFTPRFATVTGFERGVYIVTLVSSAVTAALLIAPVPAHRILFRIGQKVEVVQLVHVCLMAGLAALLVTVNGALLLVLDVVAGTAVAVAVTAAVAVFVVVLWFGVPGYLRHRRRRDEPPGDRG